MAVQTYTKSGAKASTPATLDKTIFGIKTVNHHLLKDAYLAYLANGRINLAKTKKRGEVRGGGAKPWRQKGTGRARFGSSRNPIWTGGGVAFGPTGSENYSRRLNSKAKKQALKQALSMAASEDRIKVIESFEISDSKVKSALMLLDKIGATGSTLLVVPTKDELVKRATNNLPAVKTTSANYLSTFDVMNADTIVITKKSLDIISGQGEKDG